MKLGFTLIELMVVIAIMGILITMGISSYKSTQMKSRDTRRKNDLAAVARALNLYLLDNDDYPLAEPLTGEIKACGSAASVTVCEWGVDQFTNSAKDKPTTIYMVKLPIDPASNFNFSYIYKRSGAGQFQLYARLENSQDSDYSAKSFNCGTAGVCSYGIASSNTTP